VVIVVWRYYVYLKVLMPLTGLCVGATDKVWIYVFSW